jgi:hypothetical protein
MVESNVHCGSCIAGVIRDGRYHGPADLDAIKDSVAASQSAGFAAVARLPR